MSRFRIAVPQAEVDDLRLRAAATRWPSPAAEDDWSWGTPVGVLQPLVERWADAYDWRSSEARWNAFHQVLLPVGGTDVHVVRAGTPGATPLVLIHGWPDGFLRFEKAIPLLADRFDIVIPSIPGYGFSGSLPIAGPPAVADIFHEVMQALGLPNYLAHGADLGSAVAEMMAARHPEHVLGLHLGDVPVWHRYAVDPARLDQDGHAYLEAMNAWFAEDGAYAHQHRTRPQTVGYGLTDSPAALAAWMLEKFRNWSDCDGDPWSRFTPDEMLDNLSLYWLTRTPASAARYYRASSLAGPTPDARSHTPTAFTIFPRDICPAPRTYAELFFDVARFTVAPAGGHFGPWEEPAFFAGEVRSFADELGL